MFTYELVTTIEVKGPSSMPTLEVDVVYFFLCNA
jgi:hypothetical protein